MQYFREHFNCRGVGHWCKQMGYISQGRNGMDRALCDTILKFGMMLGLGKSFSKTTGYKLAEHPGGR